jgi:hypothetical protein
MPDATHYTYRVAWSVDDGEHVATVAEFPSLSWLAATPVEALAGLADVVGDVLTDLACEPQPACFGSACSGLTMVIAGYLTFAIATRPSISECPGHRDVDVVIPRWPGPHPASG